MNPKVSIIVPVYNVEKYLDECVQSIQKQTYKNIEIILVDDGSPDHSPQMCDEYAQKDSRIKVIHKKNGGLSSARNAGIDAATGEYIMFIDSDDFIEPIMVEKLLELKENTNTEVVACNIDKFEGSTYKTIKDKNTFKDIAVFDKQTYLKKLLLRTIDCTSCNKLYQKGYIGDIRFWEGVNNEDHLFLFKLYQKCNKIAYTDKVYYHYRTTPNSITTKKLNDRSFDILKNKEVIKQIIEKNKLDLNKEFHIYNISICLNYARAIYRNKVVEEYKDRYNYFCKTIKDNIFTIIFNTHFSCKDKMVAVYLILHNIIKK